MVQILTVGLGAGLAAAITFAAMTAGASFAVLLFYLAPLPILIAAMGFSHWAGLVGAAGGTALLAAWFNPLFVLVFLCGIALPSWWLGYLALLARPSAEPAGAPATGTPHLDWYPPGRLVLWTAIIGALTVAAALPAFGADADAVRATFRAALARMGQTAAGTSAGATLGLPTDPNAPVFQVLAVALPPAAAALMTTTYLFNLWLAGRVVTISGRLTRPWPRLASLAMPFAAPALFAFGVAGTYLPGMIGILAGLFAATTSVAFAAVGLAVVHDVTGPVRGRTAILSGLYASLALLGWPIVIFVLVGLLDSAFDLRTLAARRRGAPPPTRT